MELQYFDDVGTLTTFRWDGVVGTAGLVGQRLGLVLASVGLVAGSGLFFRRFDPSPEGWTRRVRNVGSGDADEAAAPSSGENDPVPGAAAPSSAHPSLDTLPDRRTPRPLRLIWAELRLALGSQSRTWGLGALGIVVAGFVVPSSAGLLILAWLWPMPLWAALGTRPAVHQTIPLLATTLYPRARRVAAWGAGVLVALGLTLGPLLLVGNWGVLVGAAFVPALALAAGHLAGTPRLFEITFLLLWYLGPANRQAALDFGGVTAAPPATQIGFLGAAILLLGMSVARR